LLSCKQLPAPTRHRAFILQRSVRSCLHTSTIVGCTVGFRILQVAGTSQRMLVLDKDVARLCSYRGEEWKTLYFPPFSPPWFFSRGEKFILHIIWILLMVKCLSFGALCSGVISYFATQLKVLALVEVYKIITRKKTFSSMCREKKW